MTDHVALWIAGLLAVLIAADLALNGGETLLFLARKFLGVMDWVEFWR